MHRYLVRDPDGLIEQAKCRTVSPVALLIVALALALLSMGWRTAHRPPPQEPPVKMVHPGVRSHTAPWMGREREIKHRRAAAFERGQRGQGGRRANPMGRIEERLAADQQDRSSGRR